MTFFRQFGSLVHEIGHGIGFWHEQSRSDRDTYVSILTHNIRPGALGNFDLEVDNPWGVPYDYKSDMHYSGKVLVSAVHGCLLNTVMEE